MRVAMSAATTMPTSVWSPGNPLPMSWRSVPSSSRSGAADPVGHGGGVGRRLEQVPVDGESVVRVALGLVPHRRPFGYVALEQLALVERLQRRHGGGPGGQYLDQASRTLSGHGTGGAGARRPAD